MKLLLKEYLASLRERGELDAILPDLLSELGLNVFSRPKRGTRQYGVDVGAVGSLDGGNSDEHVYLLTIKPGDLTRADWDGAVQAVRPSLNEILDSYVPRLLPREHVGKDIVVCVCVGGDVREDVRPSLEGYFERYSVAGPPSVSFEEWNGDRIAGLILKGLLSDELVLAEGQRLLRKSIAMLDEPDVSYRFFAGLVEALAAGDDGGLGTVTTLRRIALCSWVLSSWCRSGGNLDAAYRSAELATLRSRRFLRDLEGTHLDKACLASDSIDAAYAAVATEYVESRIAPLWSKPDLVATSIHAPSSAATNLVLFDVLGRVALAGLWAVWNLSRASEDAERDTLSRRIEYHQDGIVQLISNNQALLTPIKDDHAIDISLAILLLFASRRTWGAVENWLYEMVARTQMAYQLHYQYPCVLSRYSDLIEHPAKNDEEYRERVTQASILYPTVAFVASVAGFDSVYHAVRQIQNTNLRHCAFQLWVPDETTPAQIYEGSPTHGSMIAPIQLDGSPEEFLSRIRDFHCHPTVTTLDEIDPNCWPRVLSACRHHRCPLPLEFFWRDGLVDRSQAVEALTGGRPD